MCLLKITKHTKLQVNKLKYIIVKMHIYKTFNDKDDRDISLNAFINMWPKCILEQLLLNKSRVWNVYQNTRDR